MTDCLFCRISSGEARADRVYEDDRAVAFRDINPAGPTHILVIPRKHIATVRRRGPGRRRVDRPPPSRRRASRARRRPRRFPPRDELRRRCRSERLPPPPARDRWSRARVAARLSAAAIARRRALTRRTSFVASIPLTTQVQIRRCNRVRSKLSPRESAGDRCDDRRSYRCGVIRNDGIENSNEVDHEGTEAQARRLEAAGRHRDLSLAVRLPGKTMNEIRDVARAPRHPYARARARAAERRSRRVRSLRLGRQERPASRPVAASRRRRLERARRTARVPIDEVELSPRSRQRSVPGLRVYVALRWQGDALLFDLGRLDRLNPANCLRLSHVFVSHTHMDHFMGFDQLLRLTLPRDRELTVCGPPGLIDNIAGKLAGYTWNLTASYLFRLDRDRAPREPPRARGFRASSGFAREPLARRPGPGRRAGRDARVPHRDDDTESPHPLPRLRRRRAAASERADRRARGARYRRVRGCRGCKTAIRAGDDARRSSSRRAADRSPVDAGTLRRDLVDDQRRATDRVRRRHALRRRERRAQSSSSRAAARRLLLRGAFLDADRDEAEKRHHLTARQAGFLAARPVCGGSRCFTSRPRYQGMAQAFHLEARAEYVGETRLEDEVRVGCGSARRGRGGAPASAARRSRPVAAVLDRTARAFLARHRVARLATADAGGRATRRSVLLRGHGRTDLLRGRRETEASRRPRARSACATSRRIRSWRWWWTTTPRTGPRSRSSWSAAMPQSSVDERERTARARRAPHPLSAIPVDAPRRARRTRWCASRRPMRTCGRRRVSRARRRRAIDAARRIIGSSDASAATIAVSGGTDAPADVAERTESRRAGARHRDRR